MEALKVRKGTITVPGLKNAFEKKSLEKLSEAPVYRLLVSQTAPAY